MTALPTLLLTRPSDGSQRFAERVLERFRDAVAIVISPLQRIERLELGEYQEPRGLIFTSQNGVSACSGVEVLAGLPAFCVGPQTTAAAKAAGFQAINCGGDAEAVVAAVLSQSPNGRLLHIRGEHGRGQIAERLTEAGIPTDERTVYRQVAQPLSDEALALLEGGQSVIAPLFSPRSAALFVKSLPEGAAPWVAVISPNAAEQLDDMLQRRMMVANTPDAQGMLDAIESLLIAIEQT